MRIYLFSQPQEISDCSASLAKSFTPHPLGYEPHLKPVNTDSKLAKENIDSKLAKENADSKLAKENADSKLAKENSKKNSDPCSKVGTDSDTNLKSHVQFDSTSVNIQKSIADNTGGQSEECSLKKIIEKKKTKSEYVPKSLPQRMGSWMAYLAGIRVRACKFRISKLSCLKRSLLLFNICLYTNNRIVQSKDKCFDSRGRTSLRIPVRSTQENAPPSLPRHCLFHLWTLLWTEFSYIFFRILFINISSLVS